MSACECSEAVDGDPPCPVHPRDPVLEALDLMRQYAGAFDNEYNLVRAEIERLRAREQELQNGLTLKGWWCICDMFNGEEKEPRTECRSCGQAKKVRPPRHA